jgi:TetR/AcrR family transcriptional repressor of nem operon
MRKGDQTREYIIKQAANIFNQHGYVGSSVSDIMRETGLRKGGIYNHFQSKDELVLAAFDYAIQQVSKRYAQAIEGKRTALEQLIAIISVYDNIIEDPPLKGGCPLLNTAVESDDTDIHPALREKAREAMDRWLRFIRITINKGIKQGEIRDQIDVDSVATFILSTIEGGVMVSKLYEDSAYMHSVIVQLTHYIDHTLRKTKH